jgi:ABC-type ATPase involved in cell division
VTVARAAVARPQLLVADEPVSHQDDVHAGAILRLLRSLSEGGGACMIFTRNPDTVPDADHVIGLEVRG